MGRLLARLLPADIRHDDEARAVAAWLADGIEALIRLGAPAKG